MELKKKDFIKPTRYDLKKGKIRPIYLNYKEEKDLLGYAMLNFRVKNDHSPELPYVRAEIGGDGKKEADTIIWNHQKWNVTFVDPWLYDPKLSKEERNKYLHQKDFTTVKAISFFITVDAYFFS
jgi:hypothetical protein